MQIPQNLAAENAVLGIILNVTTAIADVISLGITVDHFFSMKNKSVFKQMIKLSSEGVTIDLLSVSTGGEGIDPVYIVTLIEGAPLSENIEYYIKQLIDAHERRLVLKAASKISKYAVEPRDANVVEYAASQIDQIARGATGSMPESIRSVTNSTMQEIEQSIVDSLQGEAVNLKTGIEKLDANFQPHAGDLIIIAGRPSMGKTALGINFAMNFAKSANGLFFTLEMSKNDIAMRMASIASKIPVKKMRSGDLTEQEQDALMAGLQANMAHEFQIDDEMGQTLEKIRSKIRLASLSGDLKWIMIDYLTLIKSGDQKLDKRLQIDRITKSLKSLAKELKLPIFVMAQINRAAEGQQSKKPTLSTLKESGSIEEDADACLMIFRESYQDYKANVDRTLRDDQALIIIAKNRHGEVGEVLVGLDLSIGKFYNNAN